VQSGEISVLAWWMGFQGFLEPHYGFNLFLRAVILLIKVRCITSTPNGLPKRLELSWCRYLTSVSVFHCFYIWSVFGFGSSNEKDRWVFSFSCLLMHCGLVQFSFPIVNINV